MGKPINKNTKNFEELLGHLNTPSDDLDAFEQEALEGFALLDNKQEAIDLKARVDKRMEEEVVKKRRPLFIYWSAAAGIALLAGLIFIFNNTASFDKQALAENSPAQNEQKDLEGKSVPNVDLSKTQPVATGSTKGEESYGAAHDAKQGVMQSNEQQRASAGGKAGESTVNSLSESDSKADVAKEESEKSNKNLETKPADDESNAKKAPGEPQSVPSSNAAGSGLADYKSKGKDEDKELNQNTADVVFSRKIKKEKSASAETKSSSEASPTTSSPKKVKSEIEGPFEKSTIKAASLSISEGELAKLITKFFADKDYKKSFSCILTINNSNKVEEILFAKPDLFNKSETKEITAFFKKQKCFKNNEYALYSTYKVNYVSE